MNHHITRPVAATVAALALLLGHATASHAQVITDISLFRQNATGDTITEGWNTRGADSISNLYLKSGDNFINSGDASLARISLNLTVPGTYTYSFFGENVNANTTPSLGINFFTNNATNTPTISARGANGGGFIASNRSTSDVFFTAVTGANTLSFSTAGRQVVLSAFTYNTTSGTDLVQSFNNVSGGTTDTTGSFTLTVTTAVPESGTLALLGFALLPVALGVVRRRK